MGNVPDAAAPRIVTFYSYKGGTGRSMALANVAWILAANGHRVAVIDWDLEAPGLHRYFHPYLRDPKLTDSSGVIDFVMSYAREAIKPARHDTSETWYQSYANLLRHASSLRYDFPVGTGTIDFIPSGRQGPDYAARVNSFNWSAFYENQQGGLFLEAAKQSLSKYNYVLIDSRTGVSDTAGICTVQMPHVLVVCFTPNTQSIEGASAIAQSADQQRTRPDGTRTLTILPVMTRVLMAEKRRIDAARRAARDRFDGLLWHIDNASDKDHYWGTMSVPQEPFYAFEEVLSVFADRPGLSNTMLASMETLTGYITRAPVAVGSIPPPLKLPTLTDDARRTELAKFVDLETEAPPPPSVVPLQLPRVLDAPPDAAPEPPPPAAAPSKRGSRRKFSAPLYWWYVSYAHQDRDSYVAQFLEDLGQSIKQQTGSETLGFVNSTHVAMEEAWSEAVVNGLASSRTLVALVSPSLIYSAFCGREWQFFVERQRLVGFGRPGTFPILWIPTRQPLPRIMMEAQFSSPELPEVYRTEGLQFLMQLNRYRDDYRRTVRAFARVLAEMGESQAIPIGAEVPAFDQLGNAFADVPSLQDAGDRSIQFAYIVGTRDEMREHRDGSNDAYGETFADWTPFPPGTVSSITRNAATALERAPNITEGIPDIDALRADGRIVIFLIDAWAFVVPRVRDALALLDREPPTHWAFVIVLDSYVGTKRHEAAFEALTMETLPNAQARAGRVRFVRSSAELDGALHATVTTLELELISSASSQAPPRATLPKLSKLT